MSQDLDALINRRKQIAGMIGLIQAKLDSNNEAMLTRKRDARQFFVKHYTNEPDSWFLYDGCDLVIGDVTLPVIASTLLDNK